MMRYKGSTHICGGSPLMIVPAIPRRLARGVIATASSA